MYHLFLMKRTAQAFGKIILSGDHAVVHGYPAIAIPSTRGITATFEEDTAKDSLLVDWKGIDEEWKTYCGRIIAECGMMKGDVFRGKLKLQTTIPLGKGMGSSTALLIAVCRVLLGERSLDATRKIEDRMNPGNSGLDFTVIWSGKPILFQKTKPAKKLSTPIRLPHALLIDTGSPNETTPELVAWVKSRITEPQVNDALKSIGHCTERLIAGESPFAVFPDHTQAQVALGVVPERTQKLIKEIEESGGAAKVIGAGGRTGGGGMVLAIHESLGELQSCIPSDLRAMQL